MQIVPLGDARDALRPRISRAARSLVWRKKPAVRAFTLVEVAFSIGVIVFAFIPILGLIPTGMSVFQQANNASLTAQIVQRVANDVKQTNFDTLIGNGTAAMAPGGIPISQGGTLEPRYFDIQCNEVIPANPWQPIPAELTHVIFYVNALVTSPTSLPSTSGSAPSPNLATVKIQIAELPGQTQNPFLAAGKLTCPTFPVLVARGKTIEPSLTQ